MKTLIASKQTEEQRRSNEYIRYQFIVAMMNMDEKMIQPLLKKEAKFFGHMNSWQLLHWFKKQFSTLGTPMVHSKFNEGISIDIYPGSDMFEFSFAPMDENTSVEDTFLGRLKEEAIFSSKNTLKLTLVLVFENGKIADMRIPKKTICFEKAKRFQEEN